MMKSQTIDLIAQVSEVTKDLWFLSESEFPFKVFAIAPEERFENRHHLSVETLLRHIGFLEPQRVEDFLDYVLDIEKYRFHKNPDDTAHTFAYVSEKYQTLLNLCQTHLSNFQIYRVGRKKLDDEDWIESVNEFTDIFYLLIGQTIDGEWIGWCPSMEVDEYATPTSDSREIIHNEVDFIKKNTLELMRSIESETLGLIFPKESLSENQVEWTNEFWLKATGQRKTIVDRMILNSKFVRVFEFESFSAEFLSEPFGGLTEEDQEYGEQLKSLDVLLRSHLKHPRTYMIGCHSCFWLYTLGQTRQGDWVGVSTQGIWT